MLRCRKDLGQFAEVLGGCGEEEFVVCAARAAQSEPPEAEDAFEVREEHLDLLSQLHRDVVLAGFGNVAGNLTGVFVFFASESGIGIRAAFLFRRAYLTGQFQGAVFGAPLAGWSPVRVGIVPAELLEGMALGADILIVRSVPFEVRPRPGSVVAPRLVDDRNVRCDVAVDQPPQERPGAVGGVCDQPFCRSNLSFTRSSMVLIEPASACRIDLVTSTSTMTP